MMNNICIAFFRSSRLSSRSGIPILQSVPSIVRTAKAERRMKERLIQEVKYVTNYIMIKSNCTGRNISFDFQGLLSDDDDESHLTPAEQRALKAEKRAAWRQARLKSLEQVRV